MQINYHIELENAIENNNSDTAIKILKLYKDKIEDMTYYLWLAIEDGNWGIAKILICYGTINHNQGTYEIDTPLNELLAWEDGDFKLFSYLLQDGSNPNYLDEEVTQLHKRVTGAFFGTPHGYYDIVKLLLQYGSQVYLNTKVGLCNCSVLEKVITNGYDYNMIKLLLDFGTDPEIPDEYGDSMLSILASYKDKYTQEDYIKIEKLLNPNNPPYLKLGEPEDDKYIIYENKDIETNPQPYLLTDKKKYSDKKYLYADNKSDAFVYWAYKNNLLTEPLEKVIKKYLTLTGEVTAKNIGQLMTSTIGHELTSDMFNVEGKPFAVSYPTVTHWWYNLHTDFNRLYQDESTRLPRAIKSQEEFDTLMKLLDIRYTQFKSGKDFNSNQNKAELQALIEGKEPPKREVDLSWLEEHCGEDDLSDVDTKVTDDKTKEEPNKGNNIIPDDFFVKE